MSPEIATIEKIKAIYSDKIEIVTEEDIVKAIENKTPNTLILHKVGPVGDRKSGYCFKMLIGTDDSNMYYYNQHHDRQIQSEWITACRSETTCKVDYDAALVKHDPSF